MSEPLQLIDDETLEDWHKRALATVPMAAGNGGPDTHTPALGTGLYVSKLVEAVKAHRAELVRLRSGAHVLELLGACDAYHEAIDRLFAALIVATDGAKKPFRPSESGQPWDAARKGLALCRRVRQELQRPDAPALASQPALIGKHAVVLYFDAKADADEIVELIQEGKPTMRSVHL